MIKRILSFLHGFLAFWRVSSKERKFLSAQVDPRCDPESRIQIEDAMMREHANRMMIDDGYMPSNCPRCGATVYHRDGKSTTCHCAQRKAP